MGCVSNSKSRNGFLLSSLDNCDHAHNCDRCNPWRKGFIILSCACTQRNDSLRTKGGWWEQGEMFVSYVTLMTVSSNCSMIEIGRRWTPTWLNTKTTPIQANGKFNKTRLTTWSLFGKVVKVATQGFNLTTNKNLIKFLGVTWRDAIAESGEVLCAEF